MHAHSPKFTQNFHELTPWIPQDEKPQFIINDITLRDGKQAMAWWNLWTKEEAAIFVKLLADAGVHHAEIGFPAVQGDPETEGVKHIVEQNKDRDIALFGLTRLVRSDIETAMDVLKSAKHKGIHTFIGTSPQHREARNMTPEKILTDIHTAVSLARDNGFMVQFSAEDATRTEHSFMQEAYGTAVESGAHILNVPDTLGYVDADDYVQLTESVHRAFPNQIISTHTHNDWGQAEQSAQLAVKHGFAQRLEGTVFGIGERAGNADWVSIIMGMLSCRNDGSESSKRYCQLSEKLLKNPRLLAKVTEYFEQISGLHMRPVSPGHGYEAQVNRSGVHQAEVRKMKSTYLWQSPEMFGFSERPKFDITPLSGKHGVHEVLFSLGIEADDNSNKRMTEFYRLLFSPDTTQQHMEEKFPDVSQEDIDRLWQKVSTLRETARTHKNNEQNMRGWMKETDDILTEAFFIVHPDYTFGPYQVGEFEFRGHEKMGNGGKKYQARIIINGTTVEAEKQGEIDAVVAALQEYLRQENLNIEYTPGTVTPLKDKESQLTAGAVGELQATMIDNETGTEITFAVRDHSTATTHRKAFMRGLNRLMIMRQYRQKQAELAN